VTACQHQSRRREGRRPQTISLQRREPALACLSDMVPVPREYPFCSSSRRSGQASLPRLLDIFTSTTTVASRRPPLRGRILDASPSARPDTDTDVDQTTLPLSHDPGPLQPSSLLSAPGSQFLAIFSAGFARLSTATTVSSTRLFLPPLHPVGIADHDEISSPGMGMRPAFLLGHPRRVVHPATTATPLGAHAKSTPEQLRDHGSQPSPGSDATTRGRRLVFVTC